MALGITGSVAAQTLAQKLVGSGVIISNVTYTGNPLQAGTFTGGLSAGGVDQNGNMGIGFDSGIVMSSGTATDIAATQTGTETSTGFNGAGNTTLTTLTGAQTHDASDLQFDFNPGDATKVYFNFVFGTDEYPSSPSYNDGFAILVNGTNVALIPGDKSAVEISNFNKTANKSYYKEATVVASQDGNEDGFPTQVINAQIQSMSVVLQAVATVIPNQVNHIEFAIADSGDDVVDSFVFVQGGSLSTTPVSPTLPGAPAGLTLAPASDSGTLGDDITNVTTPMITGTGTAGDTVKLYNGTTLIGSATVGETGTWSVASSALVAGAYNLTTTQTDVAGNVSPASAALALTIDTTIPAVPAGLTLSPASDSGTLGDDITNVTTPVITGTGTAGDTVKLYNGTTLVGSATVGGTGTWSVTSSALVAGAHSLTTTQTDVAGNVSPASAVLALTIDTAIPAVPAGLTLAPASDSGTLGDDITNVTTPMITGTGTAGDTVKLYNGTTLVGSATVGGTGTWSVTSSALVAGAHSLTTTQTDVAGNVSPASAVLALTIDTAIPAVPAGLTLAPASDSGTLGDDITNVTTPMITGTGTAGDTVKLYNGTTLIGSATVGETGTWSVTSSALAAGAYNLTTTQTDVAGNVSAASSPLAVILDTSAPAAPSSLALAPASDTGVVGDDITNVALPTLIGVAEPGSIVNLYDGDVLIGTSSADPITGVWSIAATNPLTEGANNLAVTAIDAAGNVSLLSDPLAVTLDTKAPTTSAPTLAAVSDTGVTGDGITSVALPTLIGTAEPGSTISLYDGDVLIGTGSADPTTGAWAVTASTPLSEGANSLTATATDASGNVSLNSAALSVTLDTASPVASSAPVLAPTSDTGVQGDGITSVALPTLTGTAEPGSTISLYDGDVLIGTGSADPTTGAWAVTASTPLSEGANSLTATSTDAAGNTSAASGPLAVTLGTSGLTLAVATDSGVIGDGITNIATPILVGTAAAGDTVTLTDDTSGTPITIGTAVADQTGNWSYTPTLPVADGTYELIATETLADGTILPSSSPFALTIDTTMPAAPLLALATASDSGTPGDDITNVTTPTLSGLGEAGDAVTLFDGTTQVGSGIVGQDGTWTITSDVLAQGTHSFTATQTDVAGNVSTSSAALSVTIDTVLPATVNSLALLPASDSGTLGDGITNVTTPVITGVGDVGDTVTLYDDGASIGTAMVGANGAWSITSGTLADGVHALTANETDYVGNVSAASVPLGLTIDTAAPAAPTGLTLAPASDTGISGDDITSVLAPTITGTAEAGSTVVLSDADGTLGTAVADAKRRLVRRQQRADRRRSRSHRYRRRRRGQHLGRVSRSSR